MQLLRPTENNIFLVKLQGFLHSLGEAGNPACLVSSSSKQSYRTQFPCYQHPTLPHIRIVHLLQVMNQYLYIIMNRSLYLIQIALVFTYCPFSVPGSHPGPHITCLFRLPLAGTIPTYFNRVTLSVPAVEAVTITYCTYHSISGCVFTANHRACAASPHHFDCASLVPR